MSYETWMKAVDLAVQGLCGLSVHDLPDWLSRDSYDGGDTPQEAAAQVVEDALEEMGFSV